MTRRIESYEPEPGVDGVFRITYRNELQERLAAGPVPFDELTAFLTREYYEQNGIGSDFVTPPEFFPQTGSCYARLAVEAYERLGSPRTFAVYEAGGGNGTLARSFMEEAATHPRFFGALSYHLIEQSAGLMRWQQNHMPSELRRKVTWHHADVTKFSFPRMDAGMYIAMENDDDLPSKAVVKVNGQPGEAYLVLEGGQPMEKIGEASPLLSRFIRQYPEWWSLVPEGLRISLPVHLDSVGIRERFTRRISRGLLVTTDYGYELEQVAPHMPNWVFSQYKAFEGNRKIGGITKSVFADVLNRVGTTNYTANVDFTLLSLPARRRGYRNAHLEHHLLLERFGLRSLAEKDFRRLRDTGMSDELIRYARKMAYVTDPAGDWHSLIQWQGFDLELPEISDDTANWFYTLTQQYGLGDVRPEYRKGPAR